MRHIERSHAGYIGASHEYRRVDGPVIEGCPIEIWGHKEAETQPDEELKELLHERRT